MPSISVVIPAYNSELTLSPLIEDLQQVLASLTDDYELILVNDGSRDDTWRVVRELSQQHSWIRGINLMRNYGQHNALLCGIRAARCEIIVTIDDDGQNPPHEIPRLLQKLEEGYDVVYGPPLQEVHGFWRDLASQMTKMVLQNAMGSEVARSISAFRVFRTFLRDAFETYNGSFISIDVLLTWATTRFAAVRVRQEPRRVGISNYTLRKLITHALNMMTGFSTLPLQLASWIGFIFTVFGFVILAWVIGSYLILGSSVPGFAFLASIIALFSGAQLFALGIIGEYIARMHFRLMDKPAYTVRDHTQRIENQNKMQTDALPDGSPAQALASTRVSVQHGAMKEVESKPSPL
jgi:glycosyltransferase involved in cell wall biosynthesis